MNSQDQTMILILGEIKGTVAEVKEAIRELKETVANNNSLHNDKVEKLEKEHSARIANLETLKERAIAYIAAISTAIVFAFNFIPKTISSIMGVHS